MVPSYSRSSTESGVEMASINVGTLLKAHRKKKGTDRDEKPTDTLMVAKQMPGSRLATSPVPCFRKKQQQRRPYSLTLKDSVCNIWFFCGPLNKFHVPQPILLFFKSVTCGPKLSCGQSRVTGLSQWLPTFAHIISLIFSAHLSYKNNEKFSAMRWWEEDDDLKCSCKNGLWI